MALVSIEFVIHSVIHIQMLLYILREVLWRTTAYVQKILLPSLCLEEAQHINILVPQV